MRHGRDGWLPRPPRPRAARAMGPSGGGGCANHEAGAGDGRGGEREGWGHAGGMDALCMERNDADAGPPCFQAASVHTQARAPWDPEHQLRLVELCKLHPPSSESTPRMASQCGKAAPTMRN